jgi:hypothetical protein
MSQTQEIVPLVNVGQLKGIMEVILGALCNIKVIGLKQAENIKG